MKSQITTTITTLVDMDTLKPEHSVSIVADELPQSVATAVVIGACRALLAQLGAPVTLTEDEKKNEREAQADAIAAEVGELENDEEDNR